MSAPGAPQGRHNIQDTSAQVGQCKVADQAEDRWSADCLPLDAADDAEGKGDSSDEAAPISGFDVDENEKGAMEAHSVSVATTSVPSVGARLHHAGRCKPCAFYHTKGCMQGRSCAFCHSCPPNEKQRRKRLKQQLCRSIMSSFEEGGSPAKHGMHSRQSSASSSWSWGGSTATGISRQDSTASTHTPSSAGGSYLDGCGTWPTTAAPFPTPMPSMCSRPQHTTSIHYRPPQMQPAAAQQDRLAQNRITNQARGMQNRLAQQQWRPPQPGLSKPQQAWRQQQQGMQQHMPQQYLSPSGYQQQQALQQQQHVQSAASQQQQQQAWVPVPMPPNAVIMQPVNYPTIMPVQMVDWSNLNSMPGQSMNAVMMVPTVTASAGSMAGRMATEVEELDCEEECDGEDEPEQSPWWTSVMARNREAPPLVEESAEEWEGECDGELEQTEQMPVVQACESDDDKEDVESEDDKEEEAEDLATDDSEEEE